MDKYSVYLDTPEQDCLGDFNNKSESVDFFENFDFRCDRYCIWKGKVLYHGEDEIAQSTIKDVTIFK